MKYLIFAVQAYRTRGLNPTGRLVLGFSRVLDKQALAGLELAVGARKFPIADATVSSNQLSWDDSGLSWADGDTVSLSLTELPPPSTASPPSVPQNVQVTPGDGKLTVSWQAPSSWGTWPADAFRVDWKLSSASDASWAAAAFPLRAHTSYVFSGTLLGTTHTVTNGTAYDLRIRAESRESGTSNYLQSAWVTVSNNVPQASQGPVPTNLTVTPGDWRLTLRWTAPDVPGGTAISGYYVQYRESRCLKQKRRDDLSPVYAGDVPVYVDCDPNNPNRPGHWIAVGGWWGAQDVDRQTTRVIHGLRPGSAYDIRVSTRTNSVGGVGIRTSSWVYATGTVPGGSARLRQLDLQQ